MSKDTGHQIPDQPESWRWPEEKWREIVNKIRAGRSMKPKNWPNDAKVAVALSCILSCALSCVLTGATIIST